MNCSLHINKTILLYPPQLPEQYRLGTVAYPVDMFAIKYINFEGLKFFAQTFTNTNATQLYTTAVHQYGDFLHAN